MLGNRRGFQPEGLGQHSPGQRPGFEMIVIWQAESLRETLSQAFSLERLW